MKIYYSVQHEIEVPFDIKDEKDYENKSKIQKYLEDTLDFDEDAIWGWSEESWLDNA